MATEQNLLEVLNKKVKVQQPSSFLSVDRYYICAQGLLQQANTYRVVDDKANLYILLFRFASLVIETIPRHKNFDGQSRKYKSFQKVLENNYLPELESLKKVLVTKSAMSIRSLSNDEDDWKKSGAPQIQPLPPHDTDKDLVINSNTKSNKPPEFKSKYSSKASDTTREKHLVYSEANNDKNSKYNIDNEQVSYPSIEIASDNKIKEETSENISLMDQDMQIIVDPPNSISLYPQEIEVLNIDLANSNLEMSPNQNNTCSCEPPPPPVSTQEVSLIDQNTNDIEKKFEGMRDVHLSLELLKSFLNMAKSNTKKSIETCGILAGTLDAAQNVFKISNLLLPMQKGTTDQVEMINEEALLEEVLTKGLIVLGWIHTHPIYTCFMSSIDVHTALPYQLLLEEAVSIVMAPTDPNKKCGVFRLTTPGGLDLITKCQSRGFHHHPSTSTGQPIYEDCSHVFIDEKLKVTVSDLR